LLSVAQLVKGSDIDYDQWTYAKRKVNDFEAQLNLIISPNDVKNMTKNYSIMTIKDLNQFKGIDWIRLLNGIFSNANVTVKQTDRVIVTDHKYFSQLFTVVSTQSKE